MKKRRTKKARKHTKTLAETKAYAKSIGENLQRLQTAHLALGHEHRQLRERYEKLMKRVDRVVFIDDDGRMGPQLRVQVTVSMPQLIYLRREGRSNAEGLIRTIAESIWAKLDKEGPLYASLEPVWDEPRRHA